MFIKAIILCANTFRSKNIEGSTYVTLFAMSVVTRIPTQRLLEKRTTLPCDFLLDKYVTVW